MYILSRTTFDGFSNSATTTGRLSVETWSIIVKVNNTNIAVQASSIPVGNLGGVERRVGRYDCDPVVQAVINVQRTDSEDGGALAGNLRLKRKQRLSGRRCCIAVCNNSTCR